MLDGDNPFSMSMGDLMTAIMLIFLFLFSVILLHQSKNIQEKKLSIKKQQEEIKNQALLNEQLRKELEGRQEELMKKKEIINNIVLEYETRKASLNADLRSVLRDLPSYKNAKMLLPGDNPFKYSKAGSSKNIKIKSVRFTDYEMMFRSQSAELKKAFKDVLKRFFPIYLAVLYDKKYRDVIEEIRIEGHASTEWEGASDPVDAYFLNMKLSQDRTRSVLRYCLGLILDYRYNWPLRYRGYDVTEVHQWALEHITANGLSSSHYLCVNGTSRKDGDCVEDKDASRRVEFRVRTNAEQAIIHIVQKAAN